MFARSLMDARHTLAGAMALMVPGLEVLAQDDTSAEPALVPLHVEIIDPDADFPRFMVDAAWPDMPPDMILGQVPGITVDNQDRIWAVHRPHTLTGTDTGLAQDPPIAVCCRPAPTIVSFDTEGRYLGGFGGPDTGPVIEGESQWPNNIHGIYVDADNTIWVAGNGDGDHVVLNFTEEGEFIRSIGRHGETGGNLDEAHLGNPADIFAEDGEVFIADGYIYKRIIRFTGEDGDFGGLWGAYGNEPGSGTRDGQFDQSQATSTADGGADPESPEFGDILHCIAGTDDGLIFVCDRRNNRAQVFRRTADGDLEFVRDIAVSPNSGGTRSVTDIAFSPDGRFVYIAEMMNSRIWIYSRETLEPIAVMGRIGRQPGQFTWLHSVEVDSEGNLYTSEVGTGRRIQKLVLTGIH